MPTASGHTAVTVLGLEGSQRGPHRLPAYLVQCCSRPALLLASSPALFPPRFLPPELLLGRLLLGLAAARALPATTRVHLLLAVAVDHGRHSLLPLGGATQLSSPSGPPGRAVPDPVERDAVSPVLLPQPGLQRLPQWADRIVHPLPSRQRRVQEQHPSCLRPEINHVLVHALGVELVGRHVGQHCHDPEVVCGYSHHRPAGSVRALRRWQRLCRPWRIACGLHQQLRWLWAQPLAAAPSRSGHRAAARTRRHPCAGSARARRCCRGRESTRRSCCRPTRGSVFGVCRKTPFESSVSSYSTWSSSCSHMKSAPSPGAGLATSLPARRHGSTCTDVGTQSSVAVLFNRPSAHAAVYQRLGKVLGNGHGRSRSCSGRRRSGRTLRLSLDLRRLHSASIAGNLQQLRNCFRQRGVTSARGGSDRRRRSGEESEAGRAAGARGRPRNQGCLN